MLRHRPCEGSAAAALYDEPCAGDRARAAKTDGRGLPALYHHWHGWIDDRAARISALRAGLAPACAADAAGLVVIGVVARAVPKEHLIGTNRGAALQARAVSR